MLSGRPDAAHHAGEMDVLHQAGRETKKSWDWQEFLALPAEPVTIDIHCVTRWSKLDTRWTGRAGGHPSRGIEHDASYVLAFCDGGYTTNMPSRT